MHALTDTYMALMLMNTYMYSGIYTNVHMHSHSGIHTHIQSHAHKLRHTYTYIYVYINIHTCAHVLLAPTYAVMNTQVSSQRDTYTYM